LGHDPLPSEILWLQKPGVWPAKSPEAIARTRKRIERMRARLNARQAWHDWWKAEGRAQLGELLLEIWDPIGFEASSGSFKPPPDEYTAYTDRLGELLRDGASAAGVDSFLREVVQRQMRGLDPDLDTSPVGDQIVAWYANSKAPSLPS
jgi:hypothetical protein